jgi:hypothetical protein
MRISIEMREFRTARELIGHLQVLGTTTSGESPDLTELDHGLQCAALLQPRHPIYKSRCPTCRDICHCNIQS